MSRAYVLMTAMPPTKGHLNLIQFAASLAKSAEVILCTQPDEPFIFERLEAIRDATRGMNVNLHHMHKKLPQEPEQAVGFWDMWAEFLHMFGIQPGDYIVASELYGVQLAKRLEGVVFMPYDIDRSILWTKATEVRKDPLRFFHEVLPEFQPNLMKTITIFGAESVGKTTLSKSLARTTGVGHYLPEWARPYLETMGPELNTEVMTRIWKGQLALQKQGQLLRDKPFIFQDTDLFSTVGYWKLHEHEFGPVPIKLVDDALEHASSLYIMPLSNIPFEEDPLRYGGTEREADDIWWRELAESYDLPLVSIQGKRFVERTVEAFAQVTDHYDAPTKLHYHRITKEDLRH